MPAPRRPSYAELERIAADSAADNTRLRAQVLALQQTAQQPEYIALKTTNARAAIRPKPFDADGRLDGLGGTSTRLVCPRGCGS
jgi:hypothetical protein